jgi:hypothetical protein
VYQGENDMRFLLRLLPEMLKLLFRNRHDILLENLALRQQLVIYQRSVKHPKLKPQDRMILVWLSRVYAKWRESLVVVSPETVIGWHRQGFKLYWRWKSRKAGRPAIDWPLIKLIRKLQRENPLWSPQRIQGELVKLGSTSAIIPFSNICVSRSPTLTSASDGKRS